MERPQPLASLPSGLAAFVLMMGNEVSLGHAANTVFFCLAGGKSLFYLRSDLVISSKLSVCWFGAFACVGCKRG